MLIIAVIEVPVWRYVINITIMFLIYSLGVTSYYYFQYNNNYNFYTLGSKDYYHYYYYYYYYK